MINAFEEFIPKIHPTAFVHPAATLIGQVTVGEYSSIWPSAVLRADMGEITIGNCTSIQDGTVAHLTLGYSSTRIGDRVTVGHGVILHGCHVEDDCLIGMGAILLDTCVIGKGSLVAAGSLVTAETIIPPGSLVMGSPAKVRRPTNTREASMIADGWKIYVEYAKRYAAIRS